jgi:hypothetical protein
MLKNLSFKTFSLLAAALATSAATRAEDLSARIAELETSAAAALSEESEIGEIMPPNMVLKTD